MKVTLFIIALLCLTSFTRAETFLAAKQRSQVGQASHTILMQTPHDFVSTLKQSDFGKTILNLASLQFKSTGRLDDVLALLSKLLDNIRAQQADDDQNYAVRTEANNQIIAAQSQVVATANENIKNYQSQLADAQNSLNQLEQTQAQLIAEKDLINKRLEDAATRRRQDAADFAQRTSTSLLLVQGLQKVSALFKQATANKAFDANQVQQLENLLDNLEAAFQASIAQDDQLENQAIQDYNDLLNVLNNRVSEINEQLGEIALEISRLEALINQLNDAIKSAIATRDEAQRLWDDAVQNQKDLDQKYNNNKAVRADQLKLVASAITTLTNNSDNAQSYLNQA